MTKMNGDPEVLGAADPLTALVEMLRLHGRLDAEEANALDRAHLAAFHSAEASAIPDWMLRNHKAVQVPIREPEWESVAGDQWTPRRESQRSCGGTIASGLQSGRPCSLRARPGSAYCKRHEPKPFAVAMPAGLRRTEQDVQHLRDDLWRERVAAGGLGATGSSAYELGWHAGFGDAVEALDAARDSRPVGEAALAEALDAGDALNLAGGSRNAQPLDPEHPGPSARQRWFGASSAWFSVSTRLRASLQAGPAAVRPATEGRPISPDEAGPGFLRANPDYQGEPIYEVRAAVRPVEREGVNAQTFPGTVPGTCLSHRVYDCPQCHPRTLPR